MRNKLMIEIRKCIGVIAATIGIFLLFSGGLSFIMGSIGWISDMPVSSAEVESSRILSVCSLIYGLLLISVGKELWNNPIQEKRITPADIILVLIVILPLLGKIIIPRFAVQNDDRLVYKLGRVQVALEDYKLKNKDYPASLDDLLSGDPKEKDWLLNDLWGNRFKYQKNTQNHCILYSIGPDGIDNTRDDFGNKK